MRTGTRRPLLTARRLMLICFVTLTVMFGAAVYYAAALVEQHAPRMIEPTVVSPTSQPSSGQPWYYEYPWWQQPEQVSP